MKKASTAIFAAMLTAILFAGTGFGQSINSVADLEGRLVAVPQGTMADVLVLEFVPNSTVIYYKDTKACLEAVHKGEAEAAAYDEPVVRSLLRHYPDLVLLPDFISKDDYALAVNLKNSTFKTTMDECIRELQASGKLEEMTTRWFAETDANVTMPALNSTGKKILRFGTSSVVEPFTYKNAKGSVVGLDIELAGYIAQKLDMQLQIIDLPFDEMIPAVQSGKVDMIGTCITVSQHREQLVLFSTPYYKGGITAAVKK